MATPHSRDREAIQKQIQLDWVNREYIEVITVSIKKITDFLNSFGKATVIHNIPESYCHCFRFVLPFKACNIK